MSNSIGLNLPDEEDEDAERVVQFGVKDIHNVPFARVDCSGNEKRYVCEVLDSGWLTTASRALKFEEKVAQFVGVRHAIAVNSCTSALHLSLDALGIGENDCVFVPTFTFTASAEVIRYMGAHPVFLDVDPHTGSLTPEILAAAIREYPDVKCLIAVHFGGRALEMTCPDGQGILEQCRQHGIKIIEDAAHALPSKHDGDYVGTFGDLTCFSFYANKTMTTGEGGMVLTNDDSLAERIRLMRLHGIDRDVWKRFTSNTVGWEYDVLAPGFKYNMPDLCAAVGLAQLERLEEMRQSRQRCAEFYYEKLGHLTTIELPPDDIAFEDHSWHLFPILLAEGTVTDRNKLVDSLGSRGVGTSVHYKPLHRLSYYQVSYDLQAENYPGAERRWTSTLSLPIYNLLSQEDLHHIVTSLKSSLSE